jgi:uncharacterized protein
MADPLLIAKSDQEIYLLPALTNRHGLIAGATGTGKTVSMQSLAQSLSRIGVPVFMADVKGDFSGISKAGGDHPKVKERLDSLKLADFQYAPCPVVFWDVFGKQGHPVRATISDMGPLLISRMLNLNEVQSGVLTIVFKIADDNGLLLLDLKDLRSLLKFIGDNAKNFTTDYGNISAASIGAIQRGLLALEEDGGDQFFGEPALNIDDLMQTDSKGQGVVNILAADKLFEKPKVYATFLLWLVSELFENLPEVGDPEKPKLVFFFDEAHLLFTDAPDALLEKIEQVVRLIRSKGVGVYFVTQNPIDIPDKVAAQLGNRIQHALRAFTPRDQKAVKSAATTMRANPKLDVEKAITELGVGEALVSLLDEKGRPGIVERAFIVPPGSKIGPITPAEREAAIKQSGLHGTYEQAVDRESAYEKLKQATEAKQAQQPAQQAPQRQTIFKQEPAAPAGTAETQGGWGELLGSVLTGKGSRRQGVLESMAKSAARTVGTEVGRRVMRGVLGSILGGGRR